MWTDADNTQRVDLLREDQRHNQLLLMEAEQMHVRCLEADHAALDVCADLRARIAFDVEEIARIQADVPSQRHGG